MWTNFMDMHSGGGCKEEPYQYIYIEAPKDEAIVIFFNRFKHNPERVSCTCCGNDYSISSHVDLAQLTGFDRNCRRLQTPRDINGLFKNDDPVIKAHLYLEKGEEPPDGYSLSPYSIHGEYQTLEEYLLSDNVLVIRADEILSTERTGEVPEEGYV